jgi:hypothetical protein
MTPNRQDQALTGHERMSLALARNLAAIPATPAVCCLHTGLDDGERAAAEMLREAQELLGDLSGIIDRLTR